MTTFRVGQRVRIKYSNGWPELAGELGTIIGTDKTEVGPDAGAAGFDISVDKWGGQRAPRRGKFGAYLFLALPHQLEPLTPPHEKAEEEWLAEFDRTFKEQFQPVEKDRARTE